MGPLDGALQLENALQSLGPLDALQAIQPLDGSLQGMPLSQELSMVEYYPLSSNNQGSTNNLQCERNLQTLNPMAVLKRLHDQPDLLDVVLETDPQQKELLDSVIFNHLSPPAPHHQAQATQTQSHHQHITPGIFV